MIRAWQARVAGALMHRRSIATPNGPWPKFKISCHNFDKTVDIVTAVPISKLGYSLKFQMLLYLVFKAYKIRFLILCVFIDGTA